MTAREIAALVEMPRLLGALGFCVNERTRRGPCSILTHAHSGSNPSVFSWRDDGCWYCFSRSAGGDRIALVREVRQCSFREAIEFLAALAGVEYRPGRISAAEIRRANGARERAERNAWFIHDEIIRLRDYYAGGLRRTERLQAQVGRLGGCGMWDTLLRLAPVSTFFLVAFIHVNKLDSAALVRFALMSPAARRLQILGE